jgi:drug/metabolite transporter (DMT)-like permease
MFRIYLLLIALILIWGISWPAAKMGLAYIPALWFAAARLTIATITMFIVVIALGKFIWPTKQDLKIIFTIGLLQVGLFMMLITLGLSHIDAGLSAILVYTTPLWVVPISIIFFKEKPSVIKWLSFILGITGVVILFNPWETDWSNHNIMIGNAVLLLSALCWALAILCARHMHWPHSPLELIPWQLLVGAIPLVILAAIKQPSPHIVWNHMLFTSLAYNGIGATAFAYWGSIVISKELPPITTSLSFLSIPIVGLMCSHLLLGEAITTPIIVAMAFILSGSVAVVLERNK